MEDKLLISNDVLLSHCSETGVKLALRGKFKRVLTRGDIRVDIKPTRVPRIVFDELSQAWYTADALEYIKHLCMYCVVSPSGSPCPYAFDRTCDQVSVEV